MSYAGKTFLLPFNLGGLNHNPNIDMIPPEAMVHPSRNINIHEGGRGPRGGTDKVNAGAAYGGAQITGGFDFRLNNGNQFQVVTTADGKIWKDGSTTIKTGLTINRFSSFTVMNNELYICNGANVPQVWDGAAGATSNLTLVPSDWTGSDFPQLMIVHGKGNSERLWAIMTSGNKVKNIYASDLNDGVSEADFSDANVLTFYIETGDGDGITGGIEFGDRLIVFGKRRSYVIDDTDTNTDNWGYQQAQWDGGLATWRTIVKTSNDIICMMEDGNIYSVSAVQEYGDYRRASLTRPAHIDRWIIEFIKLSAIEDFHVVHDEELRAIKFFMTRKGETQIDNALVYFYDRGPMEGWIPHDNQENASGYTASASWVYKVGAGDWEIRTGDYSGFVWKLETANNSDDSLAYYAGFKTPHLTYDNPRMTKKYRSGHLVTQPEGNFDVSMSLWINGEFQSTQTINLGGTGDLFGTGLFGTATFGGQELIDTMYELGYVGIRIQKEYFNTNAGETFFMSSDMTDFQNLGVRP
ncbi:MAG: hypothetical protein V3U75_01305 [Methylococcaceae bacterium]